MRTAIWTVYAINDKNSQSVLKCQFSNYQLQWYKRSQEQTESLPLCVTEQSRVECQVKLKTSTSYSTIKGISL